MKSIATKIHRKKLLGNRNGGYDNVGALVLAIKFILTTLYVSIEMIIGLIKFEQAQTKNGTKSNR